MTKPERKDSSLMTSRSAKTRASQPGSRLSGSRLPMIAGTVLIAAAGAFGLWWFTWGNQSNQPATAPSKAVAEPARELTYEVVNSYPHDPEAYLQGLVWHDNGFYESTGLYGHSTLRRVEFPSGKVIKSIDLASSFFGEGLAMIGDRLVQLTWQEHRGFVYDRDSFNLLREFSYGTEGWGLAYDGTNLILSDGSSTLTYLDPQTFQPGRKVQVTMNGRPVTQINELEFIEGEIWANVYQTDLILLIEPATGQVKSFLNLKGILAPSDRKGTQDVLNGIAYDAQHKRIFVSGKLWPRLFEIKIR